MNEIFVFGSNLAGRHGKGAALTARLHFGAEYGVGQGPTGRAYALPTKDAKLTTLPLGLIEEAVENFRIYARQHPELTFWVTRVGCGLAGYANHQIAPLFTAAPNNCKFDTLWKMYLPEHDSFLQREVNDTYA